MILRRGFRQSGLSGRCADRYQEVSMKWFVRAVCVAGCIVLGGCGLAAAPCRIASAGIKIVPVVGHVAAVPTDACATVIDP
jgi:hypothetical protein